MKKLILLTFISMLCSCSSNMEQFESSLQDNYSFTSYENNTADSFNEAIDDMKFSWEKFTNSIEHDDRSILDAIFEPLRYEDIRNEKVFFFK